MSLCSSPSGRARWQLIPVHFHSLSARSSSVFCLASQQPVFLYSCLHVSDHPTRLLDLGFPCLLLIRFVCLPLFELSLKLNCFLILSVFCVVLLGSSLPEVITLLFFQLSSSDLCCLKTSRALGPLCPAVITVQTCPPSSLCAHGLVSSVELWRLACEATQRTVEKGSISRLYFQLQCSVTTVSRILDEVPLRTQRFHFHFCSALLQPRLN